MKKEIMSGVKALLAGMLVVSMLAGCGQEAAQGDASNPSESTEPVSSSEEETSKEKITLTIESSQQNVQGNQYAFCEENIAAFEEAHPNITIEVLLDPDEQITSILQTKLAAGQLRILLSITRFPRRMSWMRSIILWIFLTSLS